MGSLWGSDITGLNFEANTSTFKCIRFRGLQDLGEAGPRFVRLAFAASNGRSWGSAFDKRAGSGPSLHQTPKSGMRTKRTCAVAAIASAAFARMRSIGIGYGSAAS